MAEDTGIRPGGPCPSRSGRAQPPSLAGAAGSVPEPLEKMVIFLTAPKDHNPAALSSLSDEHSRPTAAVRGVLAAPAESRQTGTVRNPPFLRPDPKKHHSRPAQGKPAAGRHRSKARPRYLFPGSAGRFFYIYII